jgi:uroporphyrinogen decarboxylase
MNTLFLDALHCRNTSGKTPVWLMRQAGRYLPEYRALRAKHSFLEMCHTPELATEITHMPIKRFGFDAAIVFSDILVVGEAMGGHLHFDEGIGPIFDNPVRNEKDIQSLSEKNIEHKLHYVSQTIKALKKDLKVPLIGFAGAPFTVASYLVEGKSSRDLKTTKKWIFSHPESFHSLMDKITQATIDYLNMQIDSGVDALQIFDTWANYLGPTQFQEFSQNYLNKILKGLKRNIPVILFCKGSAAYAPMLAQINPSGISVDWNCTLSDMRKYIPVPIALQGNLDPDTLYGSQEVIRKEVGRLLRSMSGDKGFIFNLGHGILPDIPIQSVETLVETIKNGTQH